MKRAQFPARGSIVTRRLVPVSPPARAAGESDASYAERSAWCSALADVEVDVALLGDLEVIALNHKYTLWGVNEERRRRDLEAAGQPLTAMTLQGMSELRALQRETVSLAVRAVRGVDVGGLASEDATGGSLTDLLADAGILADVATLARDAQAPRPSQMER